MKYSVDFITNAEDDLFDIYRYIKRNDSSEAAEHVLSSIEELCRTLALLPGRGHVPPELGRIHVSKFLEIHFRPYRIIYEIEGDTVFIHCVLDGRRDLQMTLERRLLR